MTIELKTVAIAIVISLIVTLIIDFMGSYKEMDKIQINLANIEKYFNDYEDEDHVVIKNSDMSVVINRNDTKAEKIEKIQKIL